MADALPYLKGINITTVNQNPKQNSSQEHQAGAGGVGMGMPSLPMGGGMSQPLMPLQWLQRGGFQPGETNGSNIPSLPNGVSPMPQAPIRQQPPMMFPPFMR